MAVKWTKQRYGHAEQANVAPGMVLYVSHEGIERLEPGEPKYNVVVFGVVMPERSATIDEGKDRAVAEGINRLQFALARLSP